MCFPFFTAQGHSVGALAVRGRGHRARPARARRGRGQAAAARRPRRSAASSPPTRSVSELDGVDVPDGWMGLDVGAKTARALRGRDRAGRHRLLERPDGRVRAASRSRPARASSPRRSPSAPGTTVVGGGDSAAALAAVRAGGSGRPRVDGRRRVARADRGQDPPGRGGADDEPTDPAGRRQLEDAQDDRRGGGVHRRAAAARVVRRGRRRRDLPAVTRRCRRWSTPRAARASRVYAQNMHEARRPARTRARSAPRCWRRSTSTA